MASYGVLVSDDGNGGFYLLACNRGTTTTSFTGGTDLLTNTFTVSATTGLPATISGVLNTTNLTGAASSDTFKRKVTTVAEALTKAGELCNNDRSFNL